MKMIALPDLHGRTTNMDAIADVLKAVDVVLLPGDLTNGSLGQLLKVLDAVSAHNTQIVAVPGNMDNTKIHKAMVEKGIDIHGGNRTIDGVMFLGVGGALPFYGSFVFQEPGLAKLLEKCLDGVDTDTPQILVCHQPPVDTINDLVDDRHVGSVSVREFIEKQQPLVCFIGHIHEATGIDTIGRTQIINPGRLWVDGTYAYVEIDVDQNAVVTAEVQRV